ncbi:hypothetical protein LY78DRAFT_187263 [Colletotrichum sublineola]|nr:hypothetical protein LY78DRAFT_187263 [Colletotrichum sublineola]
MHAVPNGSSHQNCFILVVIISTLSMRDGDPIFSESRFNCFRTRSYGDRHRTIKTPRFPDRGSITPRAYSLSALNVVGVVVCAFEFQPPSLDQHSALCLGNDVHLEEPYRSLQRLHSLSTREKEREREKKKKKNPP